ncbi:MAG: diacylglycerol kinase family lipid kinase [Bacteroidetes bacterium]|nr:diacylglycerol kinase family lipid kinase [Bacteroidota bacterium]
MIPFKNITFIVNPAAGRGKTKHLAERLEVLLKDSPVTHTILETQYPRHATELARQASGTSDIIVAVGGDGTVNEVASGLIHSPAIFAVLSEGSGNDFARLINAPSKIDQAVQRYSEAEQRQFDIGKVEVTLHDGSVSERYFFNSLGIGFDAAVAIRVSQISWLRGLPLYGAALLQTLFGYKPHLFSLTSTEYKNKKKSFVVCVGNGTWEGGGFKLTPDALPDDGKFQVCCVYGSSVLNILPVLPFTINGSHIKRSNVRVFDTCSLLVESDKPFPVHGDGEIFGTTVVKIKIDLLPKALNVASTAAP